MRPTSSRAAVREHRAGRIARAVEDDDLGLRRHRAADGGGVEVEAGRLVAFHRHGHAAEEPRLLGIGDPVRARDDHLVAGVHQRHHDVVERVLGPAGHGHLVRRVLEAVVALELLADRARAARGCRPPRCTWSAPMSSARIAASLMWRGVSKSGSPTLKRDDVDALRALGLGLRVHGEGGGGDEGLEAVGEHRLALLSGEFLAQARLHHGGHQAGDRRAQRGDLLDEARRRCRCTARAAS